MLAPQQPILVDPIIPRQEIPTMTVGARANLCARALVIWPRLDRARMTRTKGDPTRIARLVTHRTSLTFDCILATLTRGQGRDQE
jgi:hypothetical protein